ncbi:deoxynucleoside kinase [Chitinimonas sp. PSY-7]|uniref:deoxynucleoside kinase n=1 Tax=Chitinimonas sp. PSY-7 TaxID=3459088 RepID=UPI00403FD20A
MSLMRYRYIVVEGPIGAGKTTLAKRLAEHLGANLLLEKPDAIPFLPRFYEDMQRYALPTQLSFLFQRVEQVESLTQMDLFGGQTIADFIFDKDPLFAQLILSDEEFSLYSTIYRHLRVRAPTPDLVIYLQADIETLLDRVRSRSYDYEAQMEDSYLRQLAERYSRFFYDYTDAPLLIVNTEHLNLADDVDDFHLLLRCIDGMRSAREYFNKA